MINWARLKLRFKLSYKGREEESNFPQLEQDEEQNAAAAITTKNAKKIRPLKVMLANKTNKKRIMKNYW